MLDPIICYRMVRLGGSGALFFVAMRPSPDIQRKRNANTTHPRNATLNSGTYELQFDLSRDAGFDYAPRQLFASKIKPPT
jgi:hypothetical protein